MFSESFTNLIDYTIKALQKADFDDFEINCVDRAYALTRFANSTIHQNVADHTYRLQFRVAKEKRIGENTLTSLTKTSIDKTIKELESMISFVPEIPFFQGFTEPTDHAMTTVSSTGNLLDEFQRAEIVETSVNEAEQVDRKAKLAGSVIANDVRFQVINSNGVDLSHRITYNRLIINSLTEKENKGYGKEEQSVRNPSKFTPEVLSRKATELSVSTCSAKDYPHGEYEVILSPSAVQSLIMFLLFGFGAVSFHESQSFITDQIGEQLFDEKITLQDDPLNSNTILASPFDGEGVPKKPSFIIEGGVPKTIIYDNFFASKYLNDKKRTTGHRVIPFSDYVWSSVAPLNVILTPGDSSLDEMIEETKKGFFINRFHYTNFVNRRLGAITGLTRDGLLFIEDGEIVSAAKNFRFTDTFSQFLKKVPLISKEAETGTRSITSAIKLDSFKFTGKSKH
ncbi:MAG: TldD/PmbA family protein [Candidatus Thorarchaeota archaeon]